VDVTLHYIKSPTDIQDSEDEPDVDDALHDTIVLMAEAECRRMGDDFAQAAEVQRQVNENIQLLANGSINSIKTKTLGQYSRERRE